MPRESRRRGKTRRPPRDFEPKKWPKQSRAEETFDAIVTAGGRLLAAKGYENLTTNHVAAEAGVGIGSLYEYFPGKDAIVSEVAGRLVDRVIRQLTLAFPAALAAPPEQATRAFVEAMHATLLRERALVAVFVEEVPYTRDLPAVRAITPRLVDLTRALQRHAGVGSDLPTAELHLLNNLVASTLLQVVLDPPGDVDDSALLDALSHRIATWVRSEKTRRPGGTEVG